MKKEKEKSKWWGELLEQEYKNLITLTEI